MQPCPCCLLPFGLHDIEWPGDDLPSVQTWSSKKRPQFQFCTPFQSNIRSTNTDSSEKAAACLEESLVRVLHFLALALAPLIESWPLTTTSTYWFSLSTTTDKSVRLFSTTSVTTAHNVLFGQSQYYFFVHEKLKRRRKNRSVLCGFRGRRNRRTSTASTKELLVAKAPETRQKKKYKSVLVH